MVRSRLVLLLLAVFAAGCATVKVPGPVVPTPPPSPAHTPVCVPPGLVTACWHQPPGQDWQYIPAIEIITPPPEQPPDTTPTAPGVICPNGRLVGRFHPYLQGIDMTWVCQGDHDWCATFGYGEWNPGEPRYDCPLGPDMSALRYAREATLGCPAVEWRTNAADTWHRCLPAPNATGMSCDNFNLHNVPPQGCEPNTGFFAIPHGASEIRMRSLKKPEVVSEPKWYSY